jgi:nucleoside 2-deoxyribosyltransferase
VPQNRSLCPKEAKLSPRSVFVATPFSVDFQDSYKYAVRPALEEMGFNAWKADEHLGNIDIMCKMCQAIQECSYVVANISDWNANVLFEIGLAYGIGKKVIMVKNKTRSIDERQFERLERTRIAEFVGTVKYALGNSPDS